MRRKRLADESSFDLFLDTICNTFGGIVFVAILLAVLIQTRARVAAPDQLDRALSPRQVRELIQKLDELTAQHDSLVQVVSRLPQRQSQEDDRELNDLRKELKSLNTNCDGAISALAAGSRELAEQMSANAELDRDNRQIPSDLSQAKADLASAKEKVSDLLAKKQTVLTLPRERSTDADEILTLLDYSNFFVAKMPSSSSRQFNSDQVIATRLLGGGVQINSRPGKGWDIDDDRVDALLHDAKRNGNFLTIAVWPNSYEQFADLKAKLIRTGVAYRLWPRAAEEELVISFTASDARVQ
ncbi:MAG: hypothetical protein WBD31_28575 [Rubripirellula sp.]